MNRMKTGCRRTGLCPTSPHQPPRASDLRHEKKMSSRGRLHGLLEATTMQPGEQTQSKPLVLGVRGYPPRHEEIKPCGRENHRGHKTDWQNGEASICCACNPQLSKIRQGLLGKYIRPCPNNSAPPCARPRSQADSRLGSLRRFSRIENPGEPVPNGALCRRIGDHQSNFRNRGKPRRAQTA